MNNFLLVKCKGFLLFLFIPATLILLLKFPFGLLYSIILALLIIIIHRYLARPYLNKYVKKKCIWCNSIIRNNNLAQITVKEKKTFVEFLVCKEKCKEKAISFFSFMNKNALLVRWSILIIVFSYIFYIFLYYFGIRIIELEISKDIFKFLISVIVILISLLYGNNKSKELSFSLPIHNLFLLGVRNTLWVLRIIGAYWLYTVIDNIIIK